MNKDLPKMYQNNDIKIHNNIQKVYSSLYENKKQEKTVTEKTLTPTDEFTTMQKIYNIFNSKDYIYKVDVFIETDKGVSQKRIVGKNKNYLITIDNEYIPIKGIKDIYR